MKKRNLLLIVLLFPLTLCVKAQNNFLSVENQYPNDKSAYTIYGEYEGHQSDSTTTAIRTTWIVNRPHDNWFISLQGGVAQLMSEETRYMDVKDRFKPTVGISIGKWFNPIWGVRLNATAAKLRGFASWTEEGPNGVGYGSWYVGQHYHKPYRVNKSDDYIPAYLTDGEDNARGREMIYNVFLKDGKYINTSSGPGYTYDVKYIGASVDFMLNVKNLFTSYNPKALFSPVVYAGLGYAHTLKEKQRTAVNSMMGKFGLQLGFRVGDRWQVFVDGQVMMLPELFDRRVGGDMTQDYINNITAGVTYRFNFRHFMKAPVLVPCEVDELNRTINELRNRPEVICPPLVVCPEPEKERELLTPVFFTLDSYVVRDNQLVSIGKAAQYLINNPKARIQIAGYADKSTGNPKHNMNLSHNRSNAVADVLAQRFGIDRQRIEITYFGDTVQPFDENDWNRVAIFIVP